MVQIGSDTTISSEGNTREAQAHDRQRVRPLLRRRHHPHGEHRRQRQGQARTGHRPVIARRQRVHQLLAGLQRQLRRLRQPVRSHGGH